MNEERNNIELPTVVEEYLKRLTRQIRNCRVRRDVQRELRLHFEEAMEDVEDENRENAGRELIEEFGDAETLSMLIRRAKKRCRPMWVKFTIRSLQALAALIILFMGYGVSFWLDKPNPTVDYVAELNEMVRPKVDESQNAAPYYLKAEELLAKPSKELNEVMKNPGSSVSAEQADAIRKWLNKNQKAFNELEKGTKQPYFWYHYQGKQMIEVMLPYLGQFRFMAKCVCWRVWLIDGDDQEEILNDLNTVYRMGEHLQSNTAMIIEELVGTAIQNMADQQTLLWLRAGKIKAISLAKLAEILEKRYPEGYPKLDFRGERMCVLDSIQQVFTTNGLGGGHLCLNAMQKEFDTMSAHTIFEIFVKNGFFLVHPRRDETIQKVNEYFDLVNKWQFVVPYEKSNVNINPDVFFKANLNNLVLAAVLPAFDKVNEMNYRARVDFEATKAVVALMRYREANGRYPDSLEELNPMYLKMLPRDPYGPGLLTYKKVGDHFTLYSLGANLKDDGGVHDVKWGENAKGNVGDYVFWPPEKAK